MRRTRAAGRSAAARIERHAVVIECQSDDIGTGFQHHLDMSFARRSCTVTHDVCNDLLEYQLDAETQFGAEGATIEHGAQRDETPLKARQRTGETEPGRVRVDAPFLFTAVQPAAASAEELSVFTGMISPRETVSKTSLTSG